MIEIVKAPPFATVQDFGFPRGRAWGLPPAGAMDPASLSAANAMVHNPPGAAAIEWALGPLTVRCDRETVLGALRVAEITVGTQAVNPAEPVIAPAQIPVTLVPHPNVVWSYLAVQGGLDLPIVLGSRSTYVPGGLGGVRGRKLQPADRLPIGSGAGPPRGVPAELLFDSAVPGDDLVVRVIRGPQWERFDAEEREGFFGSRYTVDRASDRSGYRLTGCPVIPMELATLPSEAACPGAVQIPDNGQPIVLMPDGPTVGGYPKLAVVAHRDLGRLAQCRPGRVVRFWEVPVDTARAGLRNDDTIRLEAARS